MHLHGFSKGKIDMNHSNVYCITLMKPVQYYLYHSNVACTMSIESLCLVEQNLMKETPQSCVKAIQVPG